MSHDEAAEGHGCTGYGCPTCEERMESAHREEIAALRGQIAMTVLRLGGTVEGAPTHVGNFLQRIDALRAIERAAMALMSRNEFWISAATMLGVPGELDNLADALSAAPEKERP